MHRPPLRLLASAAALALGASVLVATPARAADPVEIQLLGINDFHGRIWSSPDTQLAGRLVAKVNELRTENPATVFLSSGDNIGASTFESFIADDNPTIEVLNAAGLEVSAVGNHEFDQGMNALLDRLPASLGGVEDPGLELTKTTFPYLGANVYLKSNGEPALPEFTVIEKGGVKLGFVGVVTEETSSLVSPSGIAQVTFGSALEAVNRVAATLSDGNADNGEADVVIALVHDGSSSADCTAIAAEPTHFGDLVRGASDQVDVIFSAHTHMNYNCTIAGRPVVQAASYATHLGQVKLTIDPDTKAVASAASDVIQVNGSGAPAITPTPAIVDIVNAAVAAADVVGAREVGTITADITRAFLPGTTTEDRGSESSLGSLVADMQLWATSESPNYGGAPAAIAFMNPGGLRADLKYGSDGSVTYKQAAVVQPFANTLVTMTLTGAQIRTVLEEQWQPEGSSRPRLALGISKGLSYTYLADAERYSHIVDITFNGAPLDESASYRVVANSFLASGGDNFTTLGQGTDKTDSGQVDLQAAVDYFAAHGAIDPPALGRSEIAAIVNLTAPSISGTPIQGQTVTAVPGTWKTYGLTFSYVWKLDGVAVQSSDSASYKIRTEDLGKSLTVTVVASRAGLASASAESAAVTVQATAIKNLKLPKITGSAVVGEKVRADAGRWSASGLKYAYQWEADGKAIKGATSPSYRIAEAYQGKKLSVTVTVSKAGYGSASATSKSVTVKAKPIKNTAKPKILGKVKVGKVVTANPGKWSVKGLTYSYSWKLNGKKLGHGGKSVRIPASAKGKKLTVTVKVSKQGYTSATATSKAIKVAKR